MSAVKTDASPSQMDEKTIAFLRRTFREHYFKHNELIEMPTKIQNREFGYIPFGRGMVRHLSYKSPGELTADLVKQAPSSVFCSNAVYSNPTLPMDEKDWKGAELIFDIDASSIPTSCRSKHAFWACKTCGKITRQLERPQKCPRCEGTNMAELHWSCAECLDATKEHVNRLIGFLTDDFGVPNDRIRVYFSGNRGYHLHVDDQRFEPMEPSARAEIANYIKGTGLVRSQVSGALEGGSWSQRVAASTGSDHQPPRLETVINTFGSRLDESVTTDVHRIFRMPGTLHGNSGLLKMRVHDLRTFMPDHDPVVLGDEQVAVSVQGSPAFSLRGRTFGPYSSEVPELPTYAAVYLMAKGLGRAAE